MQMKLLKAAIFIAAAAAAQFAQAKQEQKSNVYRAGDTASMVGDSITAGGWYTANIMLYYATRFPEMPLDFRNIGIPGDSCRGLLGRMDWDIISQLGKDNSVAVLMIGMNDVGSRKFENPNDPELKAKILATRKKYAENLSKVVDAISANTRKLVLFTPSIFDQTAELPAPNRFGANDELVVFGQIGAKLAAEKKNACVVDMSKAMLEANAKLQNAEGKKKTIIGGDRVHPKFPGGLVMLDKWLTDLGEPREVSNVEIRAGNGTPIRAFNCDISNLESSKTRVSFSSLEAALPFPVPKDSQWVLKYIDFQSAFNREILKITGLEKGSYEVKIDGEKVGTFSAEELAGGVNLAQMASAPQYKQAEAVLEKCLQFREKAADYRGIFFVEQREARAFAKLSTIEEKIARVKKAAAGKPAGYVKNQYLAYAKRKLRQAEMLEELKKLNAEIYKAAQPVPRKFEIKKI